MYSFRVRRHIISLLLIPFIVGIGINYIENAHYHKLPDGEVVQHAHPYEKDTSTHDSPFQKHHHTSFEYFLFGQLTHEPYLPVSELAFLNIPFTDGEIIQPLYLVHDVDSWISLYSSPRGPPCIEFH
ncbi:MAG: hypothetical protein ACQER7_13425 [Bacteroidota bacterium]